MKNAKVNLYNTLNTFLSTGVMEVEFTKKDGELRKMSCTTKLDYIPEDKRPLGESVLPHSEEVIRVYDVNAEGWRSFRVANVIKFGFKNGNA